MGIPDTVEACTHLFYDFCQYCVFSHEYEMIDCHLISLSIPLCHDQVYLFYLNLPIAGFKKPTVHYWLSPLLD